MLEAEGSFGGSLSIKYYDDSSFTTQLDMKSILPGQELFAQVEWDVKTLPQIRFFIDDCNVSDVDDMDKALKIVDSTCFSQVVSSQPLGAASNTEKGAKAVTQNSQFQYQSFSFDTKTSNKQKLECGVKLCLVENGKK